MVDHDTNWSSIHEILLSADSLGTLFVHFTSINGDLCIQSWCEMINRKKGKQMVVWLGRRRMGREVMTCTDNLFIGTHHEWLSCCRILILIITTSCYKVYREYCKLSHIVTSQEFKYSQSSIDHQHGLLLIAERSTYALYSLYFPVVIFYSSPQSAIVEARPGSV